MIEYIKKLKIEGKSINTIKTYETQLSSWIAYLGDREPTIFIYNDYIASKNCSHSTQNLIGVILTGYYNYLVNIGGIGHNPLDDIKIIKKSRKIPNVLNDDEIKQLLKAPKSIRDKVILEFLYLTGVRVSELCNIKMKDVNWDNGTVKIIGKGNKERFAIVNVSLLRKIIKYRTKIDNFDEKSYLFLSRCGSKLDRQAVYSIVKKYSEACGISKKISPHTIRHTFATHLIQRGANIVAVKDLLGHEDIGTTQIYTHLNMDNLKAEVSKIHNIL